VYTLGVLALIRRRHRLQASNPLKRTERPALSSVKKKKAKRAGKLRRKRKHKMRKNAHTKNK